MNTPTTIDLADLTDAMESLVKKLPKMKRSERIDVCARMRAIAKAVETIDKAVKNEIKELRPNSGEVLGELFKAKVAIISSIRFNQARFREENQQLFNKYLEPQESGRITFEVR